MINRINIYVLVLNAVFLLALVLTMPYVQLSRASWIYVAIFTILFSVGEFADLYFHDRSGGRWGITVSDALLGPMVVALPAPIMALSIASAVTVERIALKSAPIKTLFNFGSYGCAALAAAGVWNLLEDGSESFTLRNALVLVVSAFTFALLTHLFTSLVLALAEGGDFLEISRAVARTTAVATAGAIFVGLFFTSAFFAGSWTVFLFPPAFFALYLANRALVRQSMERERVEHLHAASRALAAGPRLEDAIAGFIQQVQKIMSARGASVVLLLPSGPAWWCVEDEEVIARMEDASHGRVAEFLREMSGVEHPLVLREDEPDQHREIRNLLGGRTGLIVPVTESDRQIGAIAVVNRVGADEFDLSEARLLEALAHELIVSLSSYRLFEEITEERERFARIFNGSTEGICLLDSAGVVRAWNPALEKISGYSAVDVLGRVWSDVVMLRDVDQQRIEGAQLVVVPPDDQVEVVTKGGPTRWVSILSGPTQTSEDPGWVVLVRDVSAEHELEQAKSDFLSTISHELRTPLTTIKGSLQVLERGPDRLPADLANQMIGVTTRGAERLERLVMNLLVVSQIESGSIPVFIEEVPLDDIVLERVGIVLRDHQRLEVLSKHEGLIVRGDRERIGQAIEHVLENAMKFGGPEGLIRVEIDRANGYAHVAVSDEGPGIPATDRDRIWERFVRLGDVLTRETQGAGVGLFIAKQSVDAMDGEIWVESDPGKGSTFHLTVPLARPMAVEEQAEPA